jgi:predicted kinase
MVTSRSEERKRDLIVVCGPPASGKTTLATLVSARTGFLHLSSDFVGQSLVSQLTLPFSGGPDEVFLAARGAMFAVWRRALPLGIGCIHDATVPNVDAWKSLREISHQVEARLTAIILDAPDGILLERASARILSAQVRPFDVEHMQTEARAARKTYANVAPLLVDRTLRLDTTGNNPDDLCETVIEFLRGRG